MRRARAFAFCLFAWKAVVAHAEKLAVVLRDGGDTPVAIARLRGQLADLAIELTTVRAPVEAGLTAQLATAERLAAQHRARAVVWFVAHGDGLAVAIATPADHRLFVREIPASGASAVAEAAAVAARGALRAIGDGGTIGVEIAAPVERAEVLVPRPAPSSTGLELAIGWQVALDAGADVGAHAISQRTSVVRGAWAASLALSLGPALRQDAPSDEAPGLAIELSRSAALLGVERRWSSLVVAASAGAVVYHRTTVATSADLAATPATTSVRFIASPELRWQWRPGRVGVELAAALDIVAGPPELVVTHGAMVESLGALRTFQPRVSLRIVMGLP